MRRKTMYFLRYLLCPFFILFLWQGEINAKGGDITFTVWLKFRDEAALKRLLTDLYTPGNARYHQFLSTDDFNHRFAPTDKEAAAIIHHLAKFNITTVTRASNNSYIRVKGSKKEIQKAFKFQVKQYSSAGENDYTLRRIIIKSPEFAKAVLGVTNLGKMKLSAEPQANRARSTQHDKFESVCGGFDTELTADIVDSNNQVLSSKHVFKGFVPCAGYSGLQLQHAYGVDQLLKNGIDGSGQAVAIVDQGSVGSLINDVNFFSAKNQLPLLIQGKNFFLQGKGTSGWQGEIRLDLDAVHAFAPKAVIVLALADSPSDEGCERMVADLVGDAHKRHGAMVISNSWANEEKPGALSPFEAVLEQAAATGISVVFSSADKGDHTSERGHRRLTVDYPATSPWATAVGGTSLFLDKNGDYLTEVGWGLGVNHLYKCKKTMTKGKKKVCTAYEADIKPTTYFAGSTGGISALYPAPPWQQQRIENQNAGGYGPLKQWRYPPDRSRMLRAVPDISMFASQYPGFLVYAVKANNKIYDIRESGTSLSCPLFSAIVALANQKRTMMGLHSVGLVAESLYRMPQDAKNGPIRDIRPPVNLGNPPSVKVSDPNAFQLYSLDTKTGALKGVIYNQDNHLRVENGWDDVTGLGSVYAPAFVEALTK